MTENRTTYRVSLLIPCYNGELYIERAFDSILQQTESNMEIVFVDDGSEDNSFHIAQEYVQRFKEKGFELKLLQQQNGGAASAIKLAIENASGRYIQLFDIDDELTKDSTKLQADWLDANLDASLVFANGISVIDSNGIKNPIRRKVNTSKRNVFSELLSGELNNVPGMYMIRHDVLKEYYSNHDFYCTKFGQNLQMLMPVAKDSVAGFINAEALIYHIHDGSHSRPKRYDEIKANYEGYRTIRMQLLKDMKVTNPAFDKLINVGYNRGMKIIAQACGQKEEYNKFYAYVKENGGLTWTDISDYHIYNETLWQYPIRVIIKLKEILKF